MSYDVDVVVAGGGPVGLMLACELRLGGASVVVLERLTEVDPTIKAGSLNTPSVEALYRRGMMPDLQGRRRATCSISPRSCGSGPRAGSPPRRRRGSPATSPGSCSAPICLTRPTPNSPDTAPPI